MVTISVHELRTRADEIVQRVAAGERMIVTRHGRPVAEFRPAPSRRLPAPDAATFRRDLDTRVDPTA